MANSNHPAARLYPNGDGSHSGRFSGAPMFDFILEPADDDAVQCRVMNALTGKKIACLVFHPNGGGAAGGVGAALGAGPAQQNGDRLLHAEENPTWVLRVKANASGASRFNMERHINAQGVGGLL